MEFVASVLASDFMEFATENGVLYARKTYPSAVRLACLSLRDEI